MKKIDRTAMRREYLCKDCNSLVIVPAGEPDPRACPTPGCDRPHGFGLFADRHRPILRPRTKATSQPRL